MIIRGRIFYSIFILFISTLLSAQTSVWSDSANFYLKNIKSQIPSTDSAQMAAADKAELYAIKSGNDSLVTMASYLKGVLYYYKGYHKVSNSYYFKALHSPEAANEPNLQYRLLNNIGINYDMLGEYNKSLSYYQKALEIEQKTENTEGRAQVRINIGRLYRITRDFEKSAYELSQALEYFKDNPDDYYLGLIYQNFNSLLIDQNGNEQEVLAAYDSAFYYYNKISYHHGILELYNNIGEYYKISGNKNAASNFFNKSLKQLEQQPERSTNPHILLNLAYLAFEDNDILTAIQKSEESYQIARAQGDLPQQVNALNFMADVYLKQNNTRKLYDAFNILNQLNDSINSKEKYEAFIELSILHELSEKTQQIKNQKLEIQNSKNRELVMISGLIFLFVLFLFIVYFLRFRHNKLRALYLKNIALIAQQEHIISQSDRIIELTEQNTENGQLEQLYLKTKRLIQEEKLFQNPNLTIDEVVGLLGSNQKYLSQAINQYHQSNFNAFVNSFRVAEAERLIIENKNGTYSLEQIMYKSGFQARSTFIAAFKKISGMTPGEFQKMDRENFDPENED